MHVGYVIDIERSKALVQLLRHLEYAFHLTNGSHLRFYSNTMSVKSNNVSSMGERKSMRLSSMLESPFSPVAHLLPSLNSAPQHTAGRLRFRSLLPCLMDDTSVRLMPIVNCRIWRDVMRSTLVSDALRTTLKDIVSYLFI